MLDHIIQLKKYGSNIMQKKNIGMIAPFTSYSGYGEYGRAIAKMIIEQYKDNQNVNLFLFDFTSNTISKQQSFNLIQSSYSDIVNYIMQNEEIQKQFFDIFITVSIPMSFIQKGLINIGITALAQCDKVHPQLIINCNRMDEVIVMSDFNINSLKESVYRTQDNQEIKISVPISKINHPFKNIIVKNKTDISDFLDLIPQKFLFLTVGEWLPGSVGNDRKDIGALISSFLKTFPNNKDIGLLLKCQQGRSSILSEYSIRERISQIARGIGIEIKVDNIYFISGNLSEQQMIQLYSHDKVKAYISYTHGESYGIPIMQFSGNTGKPLLIPYHSGIQQYILPEYNDILISKLTQVPQQLFQTFYREFLIPESKWNTVQYQYAMFKMTECINEYLKKLSKAKLQQKYIQDNFSYKNLSPSISKILNKYLIEE